MKMKNKRKDYYGDAKKDKGSVGIGTTSPKGKDAKLEKDWEIYLENLRRQLLTDDDRKTGYNKKEQESQESEVKK